MLLHRATYLPVLLVIASVFIYPSFAQEPGSSSTQPTGQSVVRVEFSIRGSGDHLIAQVTQADIRVFDDSKPQGILSFQRTTDKPVSIALLIDTSRSQERREKSTKLIARNFVETVMRSGIDQVAIIGFRGKLDAEQELTANLESAIQAIERLRFATPASVAAPTIAAGRDRPNRDDVMMGATAIWDTIWNASEGLSLHPSAGAASKAIFLISDGEDTFSLKSLEAAADHATKYDVTVYAIGLGDKNYNGVNTKNLKRITSRTGGRAFFPKLLNELPAIFAKIGQEMRSRYVVTFSRSQGRPGDLSKVRIQVANPAGKDARVVYHGVP